MRILSQTDVQKAIGMKACIEANLTAFVAVSQGRAKVPVKHHISFETQPEAVSLFMPGYLPDLRALGVKVVSAFPNNRALGRPITSGLIVMLNPQTGEPQAVMEGSWLTSLRTGAGTGVAARYMSRTDARVLTLLGAGGMGFHQVEAVLCERDLTKIFIWNRTPGRGEELAEQVRALCARIGRPISVAATADAEAAVRQGDIVVASTASSQPVLFGRWVRPGTFVSLIGSHGLSMREGDDDLLLASSVRAVDAYPSAVESGELRIPLQAGIVNPRDFVELGAIVAGQTPGRNNPDEITWFKSVGLAAQDMACAALILERSAALGLGLEFSL